MGRRRGGSRYSDYEDQYPRYVPVAERRAKANEEVAKMSSNGRSADPIVIEGRNIASTFWGKSWCQNLERYSDYSNRLPRGRTYVRNGSVVDLKADGLGIKAVVVGSDVYNISVTIAPLSPELWKSICSDCYGEVSSLMELLMGKLSSSVMERVCRTGTGLFPQPKEIKFRCSCPDWASMCKHVSAALYGIGNRLDSDPGLLFRLRGVDPSELIAQAGEAVVEESGAIAGGKGLDRGEDLSALFGIDLGDAGPSPEPSPITTKSGAKKPAAPVATKSVAKKPAKKAAAPVGTKTAPKEPAAKKPVPTKSAPKEPAAKKPAAKKPAEPNASSRPTSKPSAEKGAAVKGPPATKKPAAKKSGPKKNVDAKD